MNDIYRPSERPTQPRVIDLRGKAKPFVNTGFTSRRIKKVKIEIELEIPRVMKSGDPCISDKNGKRIMSKYGSKGKEKTVPKRIPRRDRPKGR